MALDLDQINRDVNSISEDQFNIDEFKSYLILMIFIILMNLF